MLQDQIGTLLVQCDDTIKEFVSNKLKKYSDSMNEAANTLSRRFKRTITFEEVVSTLIAIKIERLKEGFAKNDDYSDSLCDLISYNWILNNKEAYMNLVKLSCASEPFRHVNGYDYLYLCGPLSNDCIYTDKINTTSSADLDDERYKCHLRSCNSDSTV